MNKKDVIEKRLEKKNKKLLESKRKNNIKTIKYVTVFIVIQLIILNSFGTIFYEQRQATVENTQTVVGYADFVQKKDLSIPMVVYIDSTGYRFDSDTYLFFQKDKVSNLTSKVSSDKLTIRYYKSYGLRYNVIVDIRSDEYVYYTMEDYNENKYSDRIVFIVFLIIVELIYLLILFFAVLYWHDSVTEIKERFKKLRKQRAKVEKEN